MPELMLPCFLQPLIQSGVFLSLQHALQQGAEVSVQVFPVSLLRDAPRPQCCRTRAPAPLPSACWGCHRERRSQIYSRERFGFLFLGRAEGSEGHCDPALQKHPPRGLGLSWAGGSQRRLRCAVQ